MPRGNREESIHALFETVCILFPKQIVEKDAHGVEAERLRPT